MTGSRAQTSTGRRRLGVGMEHERAGRRHPLVSEAALACADGRLDRREFLRIAALLGASAAVAGPSGAAVAAPDPRRGGVLRCAMPVRAIKDPALFDWVEMSNLVRHQNEHLTVTGPDNITRPMLAQGWAASDDLKTWTFSLREGVLWHNGEPLTAQQVAWNIERWLAPETGSSNAALFAPLSGEGGGVEVVDDLTLRLHLSTPMLSLPESFFNYPAAILHPSFEGDILARPLGTGPYRLAEVRPGEFARLERVQADGWRYWGADADGIGPGWFDAIEFLHVEPGAPEAVDLLATGEVDLVYEIGAGALERAEAVPGATVLSVDSAQTVCMRMRLDTPPFDNILVRRALQRIATPETFPSVLFQGLGRAAEHHHVAPLHPDYFRLQRLAGGPEVARVLLSQAGLPRGVDVTLDVGNTSGQWQQRAAELYREQAAPAGIRVKVNVVSPERYQQIWRTTPFGMTQWSHRPLGTMALSLGYRSGAPWNETGFADPEFDAALSHAESLIDVFARRKAMERVERILQNAAVMCQPVWVPVFAMASARLRGFDLAPTQYLALNDVWLAG